jgi:hypothetical protein
MIYYSYFHSVMTYSLLFWGHSSDSLKIYRFGKRLLESWWVVEIVTLVENCLETLQLSSQCILSLLFTIKKQELVCGQFWDIYYSDTRQHANFHQPSMNLAKYWKGVYCLCVKVSNMLLSYITIESDNPKKLELILQKYENSFYSLDEYFELKKKFNYIWSKLVFESVVHKIDTHLCLFHSLLHI